MDWIPITIISLYLAVVLYIGIFAFRRGKSTGEDFFLAFSPERVQSGRIFRDLATYPKVVGGIDEASGRRAEAFYREALGAPIIRLSSAESVGATTSREKLNGRTRNSCSGAAPGRARLPRSWVSGCRVSVHPPSATAAPESAGEPQPIRDATPCTRFIASNPSFPP